MRRDDANFPIAIIGAGFAGIGMAIQLKKAGINSFTIFERAAEIGGTWRDNTYPGCACDVPSHAYSFSFEPKPDWSLAFADSAEIQRYLLDVVDKWKLRYHLRLNCEIVGARFDPDAGTWALKMADDDTFTARAVMQGVGGLVDPSLPDIKGIQSFGGEVFHTARWSHDYDLAGKNVAVIGTGASAVQVIPAIAPECGKLSVFQRTPAWVVPKRDKRYSEGEKQFYARHPWALRASRALKYWTSELLGPLLFLDAPRLSAIGEAGSMRHLRQQVRDPELRKKLTPSFQFGCKRILISDEYWASFERPNVELITDPIEEIKHDGIETKEGTLHEFDAIIFATGFALNIATAAFPVAGLEDKTLEKIWADGAVAYKGISVSGIPNWFIMMGPNTGPGHTSVLVYTESQIQYAIQAVQKMINENLKYLNVRQDVQDQYNEGIQNRMKHMVWSSGCKSWYLSADGTNHSLYPGFAAEYVLRTRRFKSSEYELRRF